MALAALRGEKTLAELAQEFAIHPPQIGEWRSQLLERAARVFGGKSNNSKPAVNIKALHAKLGQQGLASGAADLHDQFMPTTDVSGQVIRVGRSPRPRARSARSCQAGWALWEENG